MLIIRDEQLWVFRGNRAQAFALKARDMLRRHWPVETEAMGTAALELFVEEGIFRAKSYDLLNERELVRFLNLRMLLGPDFDTDPRYPWAKAILEEEAFTGARKMERMGDFVRQMHAPTQERA